MVEATIDPYNSKTRAQVIRSRTSWHSVLKQKKKSKPGGLLIKHLLDVTQKRKPATGEVVQSEEEKTQNKKFYIDLLNHNFYFSSLLCFMNIVFMTRTRGPNDFWYGAHRRPGAADPAVLRHSAAQRQRSGKKLK